MLIFRCEKLSSHYKARKADKKNSRERYYGESYRIHKRREERDS